MKRWLITLLIGLATAATLSADTIRLRTGETIPGQVLSYWNMLFEVKLASGAVQRLAQSQVEKITFDARGALLDTRTQGKIHGRLRAFENGAFWIQPAQGAELTVVATLIKEVTFSDGTVRPASAGSTSGSGAASAAGARKVDKIRGDDLQRHLVSGQITVVDFYADWCGPCRQIAPQLEALAQNNKAVYLRKVNVDDNGELARKHQVRGIPHIIVYDSTGRAVGTVTGANIERVRQLVAQAKRN